MQLWPPAMQVAYELPEHSTVTLAEADPAPVIAATRATAKAVPKS
ncbi:hypothetical protein [Amycolatopsis sp. cmx-4-83]